MTRHSLGAECGASLLAGDTQARLLYCSKMSKKRLRYSRVYEQVIIQPHTLNIAEEITMKFKVKSSPTDNSSRDRARFVVKASQSDEPQIVRFVSLGKAELSSFEENEFPVYVDKDSGQALLKIPVLRRASNFTSYGVTIDQWVDFQSIDIVLQDNSDVDAKEVLVSVRGQVLCPAANAQVFISRLQKPVDINSSLQRVFKDYLRTRTGESTQYIEKIHENRKAVAHHLEILLGETLSLQGRIQLHVPNADPTRVESLEGGVSPVRLRDYDGDVALQFKLDLKANRDNVMALTGANRSEVHQRVRSTVQDYLRVHVDLVQFCSVLGTEIKDTLFGLFGEELQHLGYTPTFLRLEANTSDLLPEGTKIVVHEVPCEARDPKTIVAVGHNLLLVLVKPIEFHRARVTDLDNFVRKVLDEVTQECLFGKSYADFALKFNADPIKRKVQKRLRAIGYDTDHYIVQPNLPPTKLKNEGFQCDVSDEFATQDPRVCVNLSVRVRGRIGSLEKVKKYIHPTIDLLEVIEQHIRREVEHALINVAPADYFMRFSQGDDSVEHKIVRVVADILRDEFDVREPSLFVKQLENKLSERFLELRHGTHEFAVDVRSLALQGSHEPARIVGEFKIASVLEDGWATFQDNNYATLEEEIAAVRKLLEDDLKGKLEVLGASRVNYADLHEYKEFREITLTSTNTIGRFFGLAIDIPVVRRKSTEQEGLSETRARIQASTEAAKLEIWQEHDITAFKNELDDLPALKARRVKLLENGYEEDEAAVKAIDARIGEIESVAGEAAQNALISVADEAPSKLEELRQFRNDLGDDSDGS